MLTRGEAIKFSHREVDEMKKILKMRVFAKECNEMKSSDIDVVIKYFISINDCSFRNFSELFKGFQSFPMLF